MKTCSRRNLLRFAGAGSLAILLPALSRFDGIAWAQDPLDPDSAQAKALGYVHDAAEVDTGQWPRFQPGQHCANCQLVQGNGEAEWVGCAIFPGKLVHRDGWCNAWVLKPA